VTSPTGAWAACRDELRELEHVEGQNLAIEWRYLDGRRGALEAPARELACVPSIDEIAAALEAIRRERLGALVAAHPGPILVHRAWIAAFCCARG
jgi:hypothetical protein